MVLIFFPRAPQRLSNVIFITSRIQEPFTSQLVPPASGPYHKALCFLRIYEHGSEKKPKTTKPHLGSFVCPDSTSPGPQEPACGSQHTQGSFFSLKSFSLFVSQLAQFALWVCST